jgi:hypothetical protein
MSAPADAGSFSQASALSLLAAVGARAVDDRKGSDETGFSEQRVKFLVKVRTFCHSGRGMLSLPELSFGEV